MITFSKSEVDQFRHDNKELRWGQAFYNHFKLHMIAGEDKDFCDKLYYTADDATAKSMVASCIDHTQ